MLIAGFICAAGLRGANWEYQQANGLDEFYRYHLAVYQGTYG